MKPNVESATKKKPTAAARNVSARGLAFIASFEGCVLHPYDDGGPGRGNATIGVGHLIHYGLVTAADMRRYAGFTRGQAMSLLRADAAHAVAAVDQLGLRFSQPEFDALCSFAFNCGGGSLAGGIARNLHASNDQAAMNVLREYVHGPGGVVMAGLVRRRNAEANLFLHGTY